MTTPLSALVLHDLLANRPTAGIAGRVFYATDLAVRYRDNGVSWDPEYVGVGWLPGNVPTDHISTMPWTQIKDNTATAITDGTAYFLGVTPLITRTVTLMGLIPGQAQAGGTYQAWMGLYVENTDLSITQVAITTASTTLWTTANVVATINLVSSYQLVAGTRYFFALLTKCSVVFSTSPACAGFHGSGASQVAAINFLNPRVAAKLTSQNTLASSYTKATLDAYPAGTSGVDIFWIYAQ